MSGPKVTVPPKSQEELAGISQQTALLKQQGDLIAKSYAEQELLKPILLKQAGIVPVMDQSGKITGYEAAADPEGDLLKNLSKNYLEGEIGAQATGRQIQEQTLASIMANRPLREEVEKQTLERTIKALNGELPIDPALERELAGAERNLDETFRAQLGPGYETSTPYQNAKAKFLTAASQARDSARRGDITSLGQLGFGFGNQNAGQGFNAFSASGGGGAGAMGAREDRISNLLSRGTNLTTTVPLAYSNPFASAASGYGGLVSGYRGDRELQLNANIQNARNKAQLWSSIGEGIGGLAGAAIGNGGWGNLFKF